MKAATGSGCSTFIVISTGSLSTMFSSITTKMKVYSPAESGVNAGAMLAVSDSTASTRSPRQRYSSAPSSWSVPLPRMTVVSPNTTSAGTSSTRATGAALGLNTSISRVTVLINPVLSLTSSLVVKVPADAKLVWCDFSWVQSTSKVPSLSKSHRTSNKSVASWRSSTSA